MFPKIKQRLKRYFFTGLLVLLPAAVSIKVFLWLLMHVDNVLKPVLQDLLGEYFFGIGIAIIVLLTMAVGLFAQNYIGKRLVWLVGAIFDKMPFIRTIYSVVRQLIEPFSSEEGNSFRQVVLIEYPMKGRYAIGFIANEHVGNAGEVELSTVFLPSNHLHLGYMVIMPRNEIILMNMTVEEALKIIVSCGIVVPSMFQLHTEEKNPQERHPVELT